jgi:hypothetical protein
MQPVQRLLQEFRALQSSTCFRVAGLNCIYHLGPAQMLSMFNSRNQALGATVLQGSRSFSSSGVAAGFTGTKAACAEVYVQTRSMVWIALSCDIQLYVAEGNSDVIVHKFPFLEWQVIAGSSPSGICCQADNQQHCYRLRFHKLWWRSVRPIFLQGLILLARGGMPFLRQTLTFANFALASFVGIAGAFVDLGNHAVALTAKQLTQSLAWGWV